MSIINNILSFVGLQRKGNPKNDFKVNGFVDLQPDGGRKSIDSMIGNKHISNHEISPEYPIHYLDELAKSGIFDRYFAKAIDNNELANTYYKIEFQGVDKQQAQAMKQHLDRHKNSWTVGGFDAMLKNCFRDLSIFGAISAERVPNKKFTGLKELVFVNHAEIRFITDPKTNQYIAVQKPKKGTTNNFQGIKLGKGYDYIALKNATSYSPYALPPFLSAMEDLETQKEVIKSINAGIQRMGGMGFMTAEIAPPQQQENEDDDAFRTRAENKIKDTWKNLKKGLANGIAVGFQNQHNFKLYPTTSNINGADSALKLVNRLVFAGMKQDPNLMGDLQAVTETFARVLLVQLTRNLEDYQKVVAEFLRRIFLTELILAGYNPKGLKVSFEKPMIGDSIKEAQSMKVKIENVSKLLEMSMIDMQKGADILGLDVPFSEVYHPIKTHTKSPNIKEGVNPKIHDDITKETRQATTQNDLQNKFMHTFAHTQNSDDMKAIFQLPKQNFNVDFDNLNDRYNHKGKQYFKRVNLLFDNAIKHTQKDILNAIQNQTFHTKEAFIFCVMKQFKKSYQTHFNHKVNQLTKSNIQQLYRHARQEQNTTKNLELNLSDYRIIDCLAHTQTYHLTTFIQQADSVQKMMENLMQQYDLHHHKFEHENAIFERITAQFSSLILEEKWKLKPIILNSLNKVRTYGNIMLMNQNQIQNFSFNSDKKHIYDVPTEVKKIQAEIQKKLPLS